MIIAVKRDYFKGNRIIFVCLLLPVDELYIDVIVIAFVFCFNFEVLVCVNV